MKTADFLLILFERGKMTFQELVNEYIPNRNKCHKLLLFLQKNELVQFEPKTWRRGQRKSFSLTKKGKHKVAVYAIRNISRGLSIVEHLTSELVPSRIREKIDREIRTNERLMLNNDPPFEGRTFAEKAQLFTTIQALPMRPLFKSLQQLHKILTNLRKGDVDYSQYVTIIKGNGNDPLTIPIRLLGGIDFVYLFFLGYFKDLQDLKVQWKPKPSHSSPEELLKVD